MDIKKITLLFLGALICLEIKISIYDAAPDTFSLVSTLMCLAMSIPPLLMIASAVYKKSLFTSAWIVVVVGGFFQYVFYTTHDPSKLLVLLVPWFVYWVVGAYSSAKKVTKSD